MQQMLIQSISTDKVPVAPIAERLVLKIRTRLIVEFRFRVLDVLCVPQRPEVLLKITG